MVVVSRGRSANINAYGVDLTVKCTFVRSNTYDADISLTGKDASISTSITLSRGQNVDLGNVINDLSNKEKELNIKNGGTYTKTTGSGSTKYYLTVQ